jgi:hypothetical protein
MKNIFNIFCFLLTTHLSAQNLSFEFRVVINQAHPLEESRDSILLFQKDITKDMNIQYLFVSMAYSKSMEGYLTLVDCGEARKWSLASADGKKTIFKSQASMYNYLYQNGWEHQQTVEDTQTTDYWAQIFFKVNVIHTRQTHLFKRRKLN